jgi:hypothetical protein
LDSGEQGDRVFVRVAGFEGADLDLRPLQDAPDGPGRIEVRAVVAPVEFGGKRSEGTA